MVSTPFARVLPVSHEAIAMEADPFAALSHMTAMLLHELTDELARGLWVTHFRTPAEKGEEHRACSAPVRRLALGTTPEDWVDVPRPSVRHLKTLDGVPVNWISAGADWDFGIEVRYSEGVPVYATDLERTLLDVLRRPASSGGIRSAFSAWQRARDRIDLDRLVAYVERTGSPVVHQRTGFVLEKMGLAHPALDRWRTRLKRGSSLVLVAGEPWSSRHSKRWNLSTNAPEPLLDLLTGSDA